MAKTIQSHLTKNSLTTLIRLQGLSRREWKLNKIEHGLAYVRIFGEEICNEFRIDDDNLDTITRLINYFHGDPSFVASDKVKGDLCKGILLIGKPGTGKTVLMELFAQYVKFDEMFFIAEGIQCRLQYPVIPVSMVVINYEINGIDFINFYSRRRIICFDDLGEEKKEAFYYGSRMNVMQNILEDRYNRAVITLATSNYTIEELGEMYGERVHSRIHEMFNILILPGKDRRRNTIKIYSDVKVKNHS